MEGVACEQILENELFSNLSFSTVRRSAATEFEDFASDFNVVVSDAMTFREDFPFQKAGYRYSRSIGQCHIRNRDEYEKPFRCHIEKPAKRAVVSGPGCWEFLVVLIETWCGHYLESRGCVRLHAVALAAENRDAIVIVADSGFGKSHLAARVVSKDNSPVKALSDEVAYFYEGRIYPQAYSIRFKGNLDEHRNLNVKVIQSLFGLRHVMLVRPSNSRSVAVESIKRGVHPRRHHAGPLTSGLATRAGLAARILFGIGLQQNPEATLELSRDSILRYIRILCSRTGFIFRTLEKFDDKTVGRSELGELIAALNGEEA